MVPAAPNIINNHRASAARDAVWSSQTLLNSSRRCRLDFVKCSNLWGQQAGYHRPGYNWKYSWRKKMISAPISRIGPGWSQQQAQFSEMWDSLSNGFCACHGHKLERTFPNGRLSIMQISFLFSLFWMSKEYSTPLLAKIYVAAGVGLLLASYQLGSYSQARDGEWRRLCWILRIFSLATLHANATWPKFLPSNGYDGLSG